jgi:hypothetical protein
VNCFLIAGAIAFAAPTPALDAPSSKDEINSDPVGASSGDDGDDGDEEQDEKDGENNGEELAPSSGDSPPEATPPGTDANAERVNTGAAPIRPGVAAASDDATVGAAETGDEGPSSRLSKHGEWYVPSVVDDRLAEGGRDAWHGPYRALEFRWVMHGFFASPIDGFGSELVGRIDFSHLVGFQVGAYLPGGGLDFGINMFGNFRKELARFRRFDGSIGIVFPELTIRGIYLQDPKTVALSAGLQIVGLRFVLADLFHISWRVGAPSVWFTVPELGTALSWSMSLDVGIQF